MSGPNAGGDVRELIEFVASLRQHEMSLGLREEILGKITALAKPDASNASAEARLPDWGQIVQILLRCMDATIKNETSREQAERMANELLQKFPDIEKAAGGDEATKSDFADSILAADAAEPEAKFDNLKDMMEWLDKPSDPTAAPAAVDVEAIARTVFIVIYGDWWGHPTTDRHKKAYAAARAILSLLNASDAERAR